MTKAVLASLLAVSAVSLTPMMFAQDAGGQVQMDPAEYAVYEAAEKVTDPAAQATALQAYLDKYPKSSVKAPVLKQIMLDYSRVDPAKAITAADAVLQLTPNDFQALTIEAVFRDQKAVASTPPDQAALDSAAGFAQKALDAPKPDGVSDADFKAQKDFVTSQLESIVGNDDFAKKDYAGAITAFKAELAATPVEKTTVPGQALQDTYYLGSAYYSSNPPDLVNCTFYTTRAASYAPAQFAAQMQPLATYCYKKYHGGADGYDAVQAAAKANLTPPSDFTIKAAPTPAEQVHQLISTTPDLATLALSDKEYILQNGSPDDATKVFDSIKGKSVEIPDALVVSATPDQVQVSVSEDAVQGKTADFTFNMKTPLHTVPTAGQKVTLAGTYTSYTQSPLMIVMSDGSVVTPKKAAPATHHTTHH